VPGGALTTPTPVPKIAHLILFLDSGHRFSFSGNRRRLATQETRLQELLLSDATSLVAAAIERATTSGLAIAVAVLDGGRELKAFGRQDDAMLVTTQLAIGKAYTACSFRRPTLDLHARAWSGADLHGLETAHTPPLIFIGGGAPLMRAGTCVGAIGVSGGRPEQDHELALAVAELYQSAQLEV